MRRRSSSPVGARLLAVLVLLAALAPVTARADRAMARALVEDGDRLRDAGRPDAALERLEQAMVEDPDYLVAYESAAALWVGAGRFDTLIQRLARVTLRHPRYAFGWYTLGFAYRRTGRHDLAVLCYQAYLELRPGESDPYFGLAMSFIELGQKEEASAAFTRYLQVEDRPGQREFVERARFELARLRGEHAGAAPVTAAGRILDRAVERVEAMSRALLRALPLAP